MCVWGGEGGAGVDVDVQEEYEGCCDLEKGAERNQHLDT